MGGESTAGRPPDPGPTKARITTAFPTTTPPPTLATMTLTTNETTRAHQQGRPRAVPVNTANAPTSPVGGGL
ncbi:hypothetical protein [Nocardiopsis halotolerans]|uniref:hypothetical protein n=1 Tax=Nocardiopsis halotolerans TaxID=124252 RepID=UPI001360B336|nr:hypothetical protein [Nocardiopsis halotolerans]